LDTERFLSVDALYSNYGKFDVLKGISFQVDRGECVCMIGPNGAGKSTVLKSVTNFLRPRKGNVYFKGQNIARLHPVEIMKRGMVYVFQHHSIFPWMTVVENLEMGAYPRTDRSGIARDIESAMEMFPVLREKRNALAGTMSGGQQRMLEVARALIQGPEMLLLDEPTLGLAPAIVHAIFQKIREINTGIHVTVMIVEQNAKSALAISHRAYVLENGMNRMEGSAEQIRNNPDVIKLYLGGA